MNKEVRIEVKIKNNVLYNSIYGKYKSVAHFCRIEDLEKYQTTITCLITRSYSPFKKDGTLLGISDKLCKIFCIEPDELFPKELYVNLHKKPFVKELSLNEINDYMIGNYTKNDKILIEDFNLKNIINNALDSLTKREKEVIELRTGLSGKEEKTLEEIGRKINVSTERVRQIESKALRKLRHPSRCKILSQELYV